ncbi:MAG TPA: hypothetical protein VNE83_02630 [Terriglobales bacterium]|nr:hypothetical protein [Terriglobales bacterium]
MRFSLWFAEHTASEVLPRLRAAAEALPPEALQRGVRQWTVQALEWSEPPLLEESGESGESAGEPGTAIEVAIGHLAEFAQADCACSLEMEWLLWEFGDEGWKQTPHAVICRSLGPEFGGGTAASEEGQLQIELGGDEPFVAELAPWDASTRRHLQANILQLLALCHAVQRRLQPARRKLWSESEADWTEKLALRLQNTEGVWIQ